MVDKHNQEHNQEHNQLNWSALHSGHITVAEINAYTPDKHWQKVRLAMKGQTLQTRYTMLEAYLYENKNSWEAQVVVTNYINALARGGMIPPAGYDSQKHTAERWRKHEESLE